MILGSPDGIDEEVKSGRKIKKNKNKKKKNEKKDDNKPRQSDICEDSQKKKSLTRVS